MLIWINRRQIKNYLDWVYKNNMNFYFYFWEKTNPMPNNNFIFQDKEYCMIIYSKKVPIPNYIKNYENKKKNI